MRRSQGPFLKNAAKPPSQRRKNFSICTRKTNGVHRRTCFARVTRCEDFGDSRNFRNKTFSRTEWRVGGPCSGATLNPQWNYPPPERGMEGLSAQSLLAVG